MTTPDWFCSGWVDDKPRVEEVMQYRLARGDHAYASSYGANVNNQLPGAWKRMKLAGCIGIFLRDSELIVCGGKHRRPYFQRAGTCTSRAIRNAGQASTDFAIADKFGLIKPVTLNFAPIYTIGRHEVGKDRCGRGDGAILADTALAAHDYGFATDDLFNGLSEVQQEQQAVRFAAPGVGTPQAWIDACKGHTADTFVPDSFDLVFDCLCSGFGIGYAHGYITGNKDRNGYYGVGSAGAHARALTGIIVDENGDDQWVGTESWSSFPAAPPDDKYSTCDVDLIPVITIRYAGGEKKLAPGEVPLRSKEMWNEIQRSGEIVAIGPARYAASATSQIAV